jgi:hypothetical protein
LAKTGAIARYFQINMSGKETLIAMIAAGLTGWWYLMAAFQTGKRMVDINHVMRVIGEREAIVGRAVLW